VEDRELMVEKVEQPREIDMLSAPQR